MNNSYSVEAILKATGADDFAKAFDNAKKSLGGMEGATKKSSGGIKNMMSGIGKIAGGIGVTKLLSVGFDMIRNSVDGAVSRVDTLNQFPRVLEQMGYSTDEATKATDRLSDGIQGLPTRLDEVVGTTQRFVTAFGDVDLATESTLALNNALLASGADAQGASNATDQYVKALSSGKLEMDTWNTLSEQMSYALSEVATDLGVADGDIWTLYDSIKEGDITLEEFNSAMIEASNETGGFAETALTASGGIRTSWSNIQTAVTTGVANVIQAINDWMTDAGLGGIAEQFDKFKVAVQVAFRAVVDSIPIVLDALSGLYSFITESTAFQVFKDIVVGAFDAITTGIQTVIGWFGEFGGANEELVAIVENIWIRIQLLFETVTTIISDVFYTTFGTLFNWWNENQEQIFEVVQTVWNNLVEYYTTILTAISDIIWSIWAPISDWYQTNQEEIKETIDIIWSAIADNFMNTMQFIGDIVTVGFNLISGVIEAVMPFIQTVISTVMYAISDIIVIVMSIIRGDWESVWNTMERLVKWLWESMKMLIETGIQAIKGIIESVLDAISGVWDAVWNSIKDTVSETWESIKSFVSEGIQGAYDTIMGWKDRFFKAGSGLITSIADGITNAWNNVKESISNLGTKIMSYLPSSPAEKGPLSQIGNLDFGGPIADSIFGSGDEIERAMHQTLAFDMPVMNGQVEHRLADNHYNQPVIHVQNSLNVGGHEFREFVEVVSSEQGRITDLEMQF